MQYSIFCAKNCNTSISEEIHEMENINKHDFMARGWVNFIKSEYHTVLFEPLLMNGIKLSFSCYCFDYENFLVIVLTTKISLSEFVICG